MFQPLTDDLAREAVDALNACGSQVKAAKQLGIPRATLQNRLHRAAERGMMGYEPVLPGYRISETTSIYDGAGKLKRQMVQQKSERGGPFNMPPDHIIKGVSALVDSDGRTIQQWIKTSEDKQKHLEAMQAAMDAFKSELPRESTLPLAPSDTRSDLLNLFVLTDAHMGMLAWREEAGADWDLTIAENLIIDWFSAAVDMAPRAGTAVLAQLGDLLHHDGWESKTPASGHILDADSRLQKIIRVAIRCLRRIVSMMLTKHERVHIVMADANHDPASGAWLREMFAVFYEDEPRITVDSSAGTYYAYEFGDVSLFMHHGHKRGINDADAVFAGRYRDMFGRTKHSYAHLGHLHSDALKSTNLMKVERHETLAAQDAYAANGGFPAGRSAKVITYHQSHGEVSRITLTPEMVSGWRGLNHAHA